MEEQEKVFEALAAKFPKAKQKSLRKGGTSLTYIPVGEVIARANEVLGFGWSYEVKSTSRDGDWILAHVQLIIEGSSREGFGGQAIKYTKAGDVLDLGDEYKGAVSDALKKAFQAFGVALYLARDESLDTTFSPETAPEGIFASEKQLSELGDILATLDGFQKDTLSDWWKAEKLPAFKSGALTPVDAQRVIKFGKTL
jgi:hypothetical protein